MTIAGSPYKNPTFQPDKATAIAILRLICVIPTYLLALVMSFVAVWIGGGLITGLGDDGPSWFSIVLVLSATGASVSLSALAAPKFKLTVSILLALVTVYFVPYPYTAQTSGDGEAIPSLYELIGVILGSAGAIALVLLRSTWKQKAPSSRAKAS